MAEKNTYGFQGRDIIYEVCGDPKDDPEQSGRLQCKAVGFEDTIPNDQLQWIRVAGDTGGLFGGQGRGPVGAKKGEFMMGRLDAGGQTPIIHGSMPAKAGTGDGNQLDQSGRNHDFPKQARDEKCQGGDDCVDPKTLEYRGKPVLKYARDEAKSPDGRESSKDASEDNDKHYTIGAIV